MVNHPPVAGRRRAGLGLPPRITTATAVAGVAIGVFAAVLFFAVQPAPTIAGGVVGTGTSASCDPPNVEPMLNAALGGGGLVTFNCGPAPKTIILSAAKIITQPTTIDGNNLITLSGDNATYHFWVQPAGTLVLDRLTLSNGFRSDFDGGSIHNQGRLTVQNSRLLTNSVTSNWSGGAIVSFGPVTVTNTVFENNRGGGGGALYPRFSVAQVTVVGSSFRNNRATSTTSGWGGALLLWDGAQVRIQSSEFVSNTAFSGGAIYNLANSHLTLHETTVISNRAGEAYPGGGGGLYTAGTLTMTNSIVRNNSVSSSGISGGLFGQGGIAAILNSTFAGNVGSFQLGAGGAAIVWAGGSLSLTNVSLVGNTGSDATIYRGGGSLFMKNSVISPAVDGCLGSSPPVVSLGRNYLPSDNSCTNVYAAGDISGTNPLLGPLADNGGRTLTHLPLPGSPLIDAGGGCSPTDQRGALRAGTACDIGAAEFGAKPGLSALVPPSLPVGSLGQTLAIDGNGFIVGTVVLWNGAPRPTTVVSSTRLQIQLSASDLSAVTTIPVLARYSAATDTVSNGLTFAVTILPTATPTSPPGSTPTPTAPPGSSPTPVSRIGIPMTVRNNAAGW